MVRWLAKSFRLGIVRVHGERPEGREAGRPGITGLPRATMRATVRTGLRGRRQAAGILLLVAGLPLLTLVLAELRPHLDLANDLLVYLVAVVTVAIVGGFWPAVLAAITASLLLNWYFTRPLHTLTIAEPRNILALLLFVTVGGHGQQRRAPGRAPAGPGVPQRRRGCVPAGAGPDRARRGGHPRRGARPPDQHLGRPGRAGRAGPGPVGDRGGQRLRAAGGRAIRVPVSGTVALLVAGQSRPITVRLLDGFAAQAGAALDRDRLRTQAAQAEALAEGNRMRTALLAAVSHDLRTPLASIKASVSTLRQTDVEWTAADEAALLATIEDGADRLDALIGNLLDMSRLATGSLQPFLRATSVEEVAPAALLGLAPASSVRIAVPDDLPLVRTDPVLLERVLANLFSNALAHSPSGQPPELRAGPAGGSVRLEVLDHGPGVPDEFKLRMFEPFERLGERVTGNGVGLGLAVAKGFLEAMGGTIHAADTPGGGLTVQVSLPVAAASAESAAPAEP